MMNSRILRVGSRQSKLALLQTEESLKRLAALFPELKFEVVAQDTVGDRDLASDLKSSPADFFTRDLDQSLLEGGIDLAIHSAKDLPYPVAEGLDWFWLPWHEDPRDAWILPVGRTMAELPANPVVGVSSERRENYTRKIFPQAELKSIRGTITARLEQLDWGEFDALLMAGAALNRLGLSERITQWIELDEMPVPAGQGVLAVTFRAGDPLMSRIRSVFVKAVRFVGAGVGTADYCTWGGIKILQQAEVCLYDVLMDEAVLKALPATAERVFVGKRCGEHSLRQPEITGMIAEYARQGRRVVRLKGGDPGLFGRLAEEYEALEALELPYQVLAGVSALTVATTGTGMLLTRRGVSRGFTAMTPRAEGGGVAGVGLEVRRELPLVLFMSLRVAGAMAGQLLQEGWSGTTPVSVVFNAGADDERVARLSLDEVCRGESSLLSDDAPGLIIIGSAAAGGYRRDLGALRGGRVLLTCSEALLERAALRVRDFGGQPLLRPLIRLVPRSEATAAVGRVAEYGWVVLTSPSAVHIFMQLVQRCGVDLRVLPRIMCCGPGSAAALKGYGIAPDLMPKMEYSAAGMARELKGAVEPGVRVLRLRSAKAGGMLSGVLRESGAVVDDVVLYDNQPVVYDGLPEFDVALFASASAVEVFFEQHNGVALVAGRRLAAIGGPTVTALERYGHVPQIVATEATLEGLVRAMACDAALGRVE